MRIVAIILGTLLITAGILALTGYISYQTTDTAFQVGEFAVQTTHRETPPQWAGIAATAAGALLLLGGLLARRKR